MNTFVLFLRGVNVGKSVRVSMPALKQKLEEMGCSRVQTYINSGNVILDTDKTYEQLKESTAALLSAHFAEGIGFVILDGRELLAEAERLPAWWHANMARRDVLFYSDAVDREAMRASIRDMQMHSEAVHFGGAAVFWGKLDEGEYLKTAYHRQLIKEKYYKQITIRNGNTFEKMVALCKERMANRGSSKTNKA